MALVTAVESSLDVTLCVANLASARGFLGALGKLQISLDETSRSAIEVLSTLEQVVTQRASGAVRLVLDGRSYLLDVAHTEPAPDTA